jgi:hypothetical protein
MALCWPFGRIPEKTVDSQPAENLKLKAEN